MCKQILIWAVTILVASSLFALPRGITPENQNNQQPQLTIDNASLINANLITMFVTNHGNFGRDLSGFFGYDYGTWFPVTDTSDIRNNTDGTANRSPLYSAGLWIGGIVNGQLRVSISEYSSEFVPGPMFNGTFQQDNPNFRNFKLYQDSLETNPNQDYLDYLDYGVSQGAPVTNTGKPVMFGDQLLWSVYNDANPNQHYNMDTDPLGVEIHQSVYAYPYSEVDTIVSPANILNVTHEGTTTSATVVVELVDPAYYTGHSYSVIIDTNLTLGPVWHVKDETLGLFLLSDQTNFSGDDTSPVVDGYRIRVYADSVGGSGFQSFEVVANSAGVVSPPESAGAPWHDYPVPTEVDPDGYPTDGQQVGDGLWLFATGDNGGTNDGGDRGPYYIFLSRVLRNDNASDVAGYSFEMRFTAAGSYAVGAFEPAPEPIYHVPFELWRIGLDTTEDTSDDVRLTPWMFDIDGDGTYNLGNWGDSDFGNGGFEHSISSSNNDPYTDWIYWILPSDDSPGASGYNADVATFDLVQMTAGSYGFDGEEIMARTVLVNWNGGSAPPFNQDLPEIGTVFRLNSTYSGITADTFLFTQTLSTQFVTNPDGSSTYHRYKIYNKGMNTIENMYVSLWADPDLGNAGDDLIGCDSILDIFYCYNSSSYDTRYGNNPPVIGFKIVNGPIVPGNTSDTAIFYDKPIVGYINLPMTAHSMYFNGTDPDDATQVYNYMQGLERDGTTYLYNGFPTTYMLAGNPVLGIGDLDSNPADRRMMASMGPITMNPGDSQYVFIKMAVAYGTDSNHAIDVLKEVLQTPQPNANAQLKALISPNPQYILFKKAIEPMVGTILFGYDENFGIGSNINYSSLVLNDSIPVDSFSVIYGSSGFTGQTVLLHYNVTDFLDSYGQFRDSSEYSYTISGSYADSSPLEFSSSVILIGHRSGDFNLDGVIDISDLVSWVDYAFNDGQPPADLQILDMNKNDVVDIADLVLMVEYMF